MAAPNSARHRAQASRIKIISLSLSFLLGKRTRAVSPALLSLLSSHTAPTPKSRHHPFRQLTVSLRRDCPHQDCQSETAETVRDDFPVLSCARCPTIYREWSNDYPRAFAEQVGSSPLPRALSAIPL